MTRVVAFVNGSLGAEAIALLGGQLAAVVLNEATRRRDEAAIRSVIPEGVRVFEAPEALAPGGAGALAAIGPTHGLSVLFAHLLRPEVLRLFPCGVANLHPSFLPWGRGAHPNAWAIARREPAGVTLHLVDDGVDTGPVLDQRVVAIEPTDDAAALYQRLMVVSGILLREAVPRWLRGGIIPCPQPSAGAVRRVSHLDQELRIDPDRTYTGRELIDLLRARTFHPHPGAPYEVDGRHLRVRIDISEEPAG